jgi:hypothetical protein
LANTFRGLKSSRTSFFLVRFSGRDIT